MKTNLEELEKEGYKGIDASLDIALYEYGLIWQEEATAFHFIYGVKGNDAEYTMFDHGWIQKDVDPKQEWDWVEWESVAESNGMDVEEFIALPLPFLVSSLIHHYGYLEIFGDAYYPFPIPIEPEPPTMQEIDSMRINGNLTQMYTVIGEYGSKFWFEYVAYLKDQYDPKMAFDILASIVVLYHQSEDN